LRGRGGLVGLCGLLLVQCFAAPERGCEDASGLFVEYHLCMPAAEFAVVTVPTLVADLIPADFDGEGLANDLAGLMYSGNGVVADASALVMRMRADLREPGIVAVSLPSGTTGLTPVSAGSNRQDLVYVADPSNGEDVGIMGLIHNDDGTFAGPAIEHDLRGNVFLLGEYGCRAPRGVMTADKNASVLVSCEQNEPKRDMMGTLLFQGSDVAIVDLIAFESPAPNDYYAAAADPDVSGVHGSVLVDINGDATLDGAGISKPVEAADGKDRVVAEDHKVVVVAVPKGMFPKIYPVYVDEGPIEALYAADLDGDGGPELIARHLDRGLLTILRQTAKGSFEYAVAQSLEVTQPVDVAVGDFTGDGGLDIAVVHAVSDDRLEAAVFIRAPDQGAGEFAYGFTPMGGVAGDEVATAIAALDVDDDEALDLALAVLVPNKGTEIRVFLNRSAGPR
jgi:hypothetical protein